MFYSTVMEDGGLKISDCSISKVLPPFTHTNGSVSTPPPPGYKGDKDKYYIHNGFIETQDKILFNTNFMIEYAILNAYRNNHRQPETTETTYKDYLSYIAIALSLLAVFIAIFKKQTKTQA